MNCAKCGEEIKDTEDFWVITLGDKVKRYVVCTPCKDKFIEWMSLA